jgi:exodeoxyribonuclease III
VLAVEFPDFWLVDVYQPNSQRGLTRLGYRVRRWDPAFRRYLKRLQSKGKPALFCGDLNVAHEEIDLANPRTNRRNAGFTDEERRSFGRLLDGGIRRHVPRVREGAGHYTWWSQMGDCRARNVGWRVDYFVAAEKLRPALRRAWISPEVMGSDHCPVGSSWADRLASGPFLRGSIPAVRLLIGLRRTRRGVGHTRSRRASSCPGATAWSARS